MKEGSGATETKTHQLPNQKSFIFLCPVLQKDNDLISSP